MAFKFNAITGKLDLVSDLTGYLTKSQADTYYVPYTGATGNVDLGTHSLTAGTANLFGNTTHDLIIGYGAYSVGTTDSSVVIGNGSNNEGGSFFLPAISNIVVGTNASSLGGQYAIAIGYQSVVGNGFGGSNSSYSMAFGWNSVTDNDNEINFSNNDSTHGTANDNQFGIGYTQLDIYNGIADFQGNYIKALKFVPTGGTSSKFLKGDGSLDSSVYYKSGDSPSFANITDTGIPNQYIPYTATGNELSYTDNLQFDGSNLQTPKVFTSSISTPISAFPNLSQLNTGFFTSTTAKIVSIWHMTGSSGTTATDSVGSYNLTLNSASWNANPRFGSSSVASSWLSNTSMPASWNPQQNTGGGVNGSSAIQIMGWAYISTANETGTIWSMGTSVSDSTSIRLDIISGIPTFFIGSHSVPSASSTPLSVGWHHFNISWGIALSTIYGGTMYVDGVDVGPWGDNWNYNWTPSVSSTPNLYIGNGPSGVLPSGKFQEWVFMYDPNGNAYYNSSSAGYRPLSLIQSSIYGGVSILNWAGTQANMFFGYGAGGVNVTSAANNNLGWGVQALGTLTSGTDNIAIGNNAASGFGYVGGPVSGSHNVAIGNSTLVSLSSGSYNTALGYQAGFANQAGRSSGFNVFIGAFTAMSNLSGYRDMSYNTAVGVYALSGLGNTSTNASNYNVGVGYRAGYSTYGSNNTYLGSYTGNTSASNFPQGNVAIGYYAGAYEAGNNSFYVNNVNQANTANDKAYSLMYGKFSGTAGSLTGQQLTVNGQFNVNGITNLESRVLVNGAVDDLSTALQVAGTSSFGGVLTETSGSNQTILGGAQAFYTTDSVRSVYMADGTYTINATGANLFTSILNSSIYAELGGAVGGSNQAGYFTDGSMVAILIDESSISAGKFVAPDGGTALLGVYGGGTGGTAGQFANALGANTVNLSDNTYAINATGDSYLNGNILVNVGGMPTVGFTGSGAYTNFVIQNGIIISAS